MMSSLKFKQSDLICVCSNKSFPVIGLLIQRQPMHLHPFNPSLFGGATKILMCMAKCLSKYILEISDQHLQ